MNFLLWALCVLNSSFMVSDYLQGDVDGFTLFSAFCAGMLLTQSIYHTFVLED